jgi:hypothetical protein
MPDQALRLFGLFLWSHKMTQRELDREIASQTGESVQTIKSMGFSPLRETIPIEERQEPLMVDWDEFDRRRNTRGIY